MKLPLILALAALSAGALPAQNTTGDITGTWQGTFQSGGANQQRIVYKIGRTESGELKAVLYNLDRGAVPLAANSVAVQASTVKMTFNAFNGGYEGKLSADRNTMTGVCKIGDNSLPLTMTRAMDATAWTIPEPQARLPRMKADATPGFEVATIKPNDPTDTSMGGFHIHGRHISCSRTTVRAIIMFAYGMHPRQILGLADWASTGSWDVDGQPDEPGEPNLQQMRIMYQKLLAERFQLAFHRDKKELSVYTLAVGKNGAKLAKNEASSTGLPGQTMKRPGILSERNATMADFASMLQSSVFDRPVIDQTGLEGRFDFNLTWTPDELQFGSRAKPAEGSDAPPDIFAAIQQQLGLKLEAAKAPCDVLIIDKLEKPSEN